MSVGVTKDYKLKVKNLHVSHTLGLEFIMKLGWSWNWNTWIGPARVYYESIKREPKIRGIYECRCDERLQTKTKKFTRLP